MKRLFAAMGLLILSTACGGETDEVCSDLADWTDSCEMTYPDCTDRLELCTAQELDAVRSYIGCLDSVGCGDSDGLSSCAEQHLMDLSDECFSSPD